MPHGAPFDGFTLAYEREGAGPPVVMLHGWPGTRGDYRQTAARLAERADVLVPDHRGFGDSSGPNDAPPASYAADGQADSVLALIDELGLDHPVLAGYDVGSRVAQAVAGARPDAVRALVVTPPLPGIGERILSPEAQPEFWYQAFHRLELAERLIDGDRDAVRAYLEHFWEHWSAPGWSPPAGWLDELADVYARPGAFVTSINWYRAGAGAVARSLGETVPEPAKRLAVPTTVLWPECDPLFPQSWSDRLDEFFTDVDVRMLPGVGHFVPLEAPDAFAAAIAERL